jgi:hypothetical protein
MATFQYHKAGNSEAQEKEALSRIFAQSGVLAATGVLDGLVVTQAATANGTVLIASGSAVVQPTMLAGASLLVNDSSGAVLDIFTANPMGGLARNDIVVFDSLTASFLAIIGVPNATPTDPTVPATSVALSRLRHAASATTIPTAKIDTLIVATTLRGIPAPIVRTGASVNLSDSWATQATRAHAGTWSLGEDSGGFVGALTADTTPITIPAGKGGLYAVSLGLANSAVMTVNGFVQITIGGTLLTGSQTYYRAAMPTGASQGSIALVLPLASGCTLAITTSLTASAYSVGATLSCYRIGD